MQFSRDSLLFTDIILLGIMLLRLLPALKTRRAFFAAGLIVSSAAYLLAWQAHALELPRYTRLALLFVVISQPVFFWLFCNQLFEDRFVLRWWHAVFIAGKFALAGALIFGKPIVNTFSQFAAEDFPRLIPNFFYSLAFVVHALAVIVRTNRSDLVEKRRRLRAILLITTGVLILQAILTAAVLRPIGFGEISDTVSLFFMTAALMATVAWGDSIWRELFTPPATTGATAEGDPEIMQKALDAMERDELFRTPGLTVTMLAAKTGVQEYKLRRAINGGLGYRNFNEYLNFYRIRAAKNFLAAAENADYPLIHVALDLGYPSPAPFNRAFKEATGMAPGEFRRRKATETARSP